MRTVTVKERQSAADVALQYCGDMEAVFQIACLNDVSITETLTAGMELTVPEVINKRVVDYYAGNSISPATAAGADEQLATLQDEYLTTLTGEKIIANE